MPPRTPESLTTERESGSSEFEYEVMYLLDDTSDESVTELRALLNRLGDCVSVVGDGASLWTVHVHCNDIGAAIESGVRAGRPHRITVARFADQIAAQASRFVRDRAIVVVVSGAVDLFRAEGAMVFDLASTSATPTDLLSAIVSTRARHVAVLPGDPDIREALEEAVAYAQAAGQDVVVVPTFSPVQALAALAVHDYHHALVTTLSPWPSGRRRHAPSSLDRRRQGSRLGSPLPAGDLLGMLDGEVVLIEPGPTAPDR